MLKLWFFSKAATIRKKKTFGQEQTGAVAGSGGRGHQSPWHKTSIPVHIGLTRCTQQARWWGGRTFNSQMYFSTAKSDGSALQNLQILIYFQILAYKCFFQYENIDFSSWLLAISKVGLGNWFSQLVAVEENVSISNILTFLDWKKYHFDVSFHAGSNSYTTWKITTWKESAVFEIWICLCVVE